METEKLTVTLFDRRPVTINKEEWPVIASAKDWDNTHECQANRTWKLIVRQHADGRAIVYGIYTSQYQNERERRGGAIVVETTQIPATIYAIAERLGFESQIADRCIGDLPAEDL